MQIRPRRFFDDQEKKNESKWRFENLKYPFVDHQSRFLRRPEGRLWVLKANQLI
jgi:hypothetical protein